MAGGGACERRAEALRLLGAGIAGGLCSTGSVYLELMEDVLQADSRYSLGYGKFGETAGDQICVGLDRFSGKTDHAPGREKECFCR